MTHTEATKALARLYCALDEAQALIDNEILPLAQATELANEDPELTQTLELAVSAIKDHFKNFRLQGERIQGVK
jgi:hypothetical protein